MKLGNFFAHLRTINVFRGEFSLGFYTADTTDMDNLEYKSWNLGLFFVELGLFRKI